MKPLSLTKQLSDPNFSGCIVGIELGQWTQVADALKVAASLAQTPVSGFNVGALAVGTSGRIYLGANLEFVGAPLNAGLHAEQSAVINAWIHGESEIHTLVVSEMPCGHCRQFLFELHGASGLRIIAKGRTTNLSELMPDPFGHARKKGHGLLDSPIQRLKNIHPKRSDNEQRAINAAIHSYTPYTQSPEGCVIESINGHHFAGRAAESIAFNPSVPPILAALNQKNLSAHRAEAISRCTHAKLATALIHSVSFSESIMRGICRTPVESVLMETED